MEAHASRGVGDAKDVGAAPARTVGHHHTIFVCRQHEVANRAGNPTRRGGREQRRTSAKASPVVDEEDARGRRLPGGEQQRVALARALLRKPDRPFLDGTAASLDPAAEARFYELQKERLPGTALVSIAHQPAVVRYHPRALRVGAREGRLLAGEV
jgi:predicted ABC-type transport system involved in lysophospholipase L1 biosynthesis ATPase subunit